MEEEKEDNFSEFEGVQLQYRRSLLPWYIWGILGVYTAFSIISLASDVWSYFQGYVFTFEMFRTSLLIPYPLYPIVSVVILIAITVCYLMLLLEKKKAARITLVCFSMLLAFCTALLVSGLITGHFYLRLEMLICMDIVLRMKDIKRDWENNAIPHQKNED